MSTVQHFCLPDAGEGLTEAEIVSWRVAPGDRIAVNDPIVEIETAKSLVELPSPFAGTVTELLVPEGATARVGDPLIAVETGVPAVRAPSVSPEVSPEAGTPAGRTPVLVGYGPRASSPTRRARTSHPAPVAVPAPVGHARPLATPPVRRLARDLGIDLGSVPPTGRDGVVTRADVERAATATGTSPAPVVSTAPLVSTATAEVPASEDTRIPVRGVRKATAAAMVTSAFTAPHVTEWVQADVTRTTRLVERLRADREFDGVRVSPLLFVARAVLLAAARNPGINASWDDVAGEIVVHRRVNLGIAVSTPRGLVVPNIKDAGRLALPDLARALAELTATARAGRTAPADQAGGTFTITNVGVFGVDGGTPILNPGEAGVLAVGRIRELPWVHRGRIRPRMVTTLSLSFDHRMVDGDLGGRFLADVGALLHDPATAFLW
jgi:2-oxoisovalerate dehydrogenase E2 component (dihydrolipoyl transacylase)